MLCVSTIGLSSCLTLSVHVGTEEDDGEHDAEGTNNDVADSQEVVLTTEGVCSRENKLLGSFKGGDVVVVLDQHVVGSGSNRLVNLSVQFLEVGETGSSHPDNEMLVCNISPLN